MIGPVICINIVCTKSTGREAKHELKLREEELSRQREKDVLEAKRRDTLASKTRFYGDAMKHSLPKMPHDAGELPAYFRAVDNLFVLYDVPT